MRLRVVVAEDSLLVREGVCRLLDHQPDIEVVGVCADLPELMAAVDSTAPDVVITDVRMPPTSSDEGIQAAARLRRDHQQVGVVVLSQYDEPNYATALLAEGSSGRAYLLKERVDEPQLLRAVRAVAAGESVIDSAVVDRLVRTFSRQRSSLRDTLTPREYEVLAEIAQGKSNAGVAGSLVLSERTVEKVINSLFDKLGLTPEQDVNRRVKAVLLYLSDQEGSTP